jgi:hypothetical protein
MKLAAALALACLAAAAGVARAGECDDAGGLQALRDIEAFAKAPTGKAPDVWHLCIEQVILPDAKLAARFLAACEKIDTAVGTYGVCVEYPIRMGKAKLGAVDLFPLVEQAFAMKPLEWASPPALLYIQLDDPRAVPRFVAAWKAQLAAKHQPRASWEVQPWARFRRGAAAFLGKHGGEDERQFLREQLPAATDADVAKAIRGAIRQIESRGEGIAH